MFREIDRATAHELLESLKDLFRECVMIHKYGGEIYNQKEADAAKKRALAAMVLAEYGEKIG